MNDFSWQSIRGWNGSQSGGFEELCVQLARLETPEGAKFIPTGNPDAGVECYCVFDNGSEWGWQAKYFTSPLTDPQWQQLDGSVQTALDKHPQLVRYYVCIPRERSDGRNPKQTSEMDRWNSHVKKWEGWAQGRGMNVEFVWWGSSQLVDRLSRNENIGRRYFWFGDRGFDHDWFRYHLDESVNAAGPRYTPEVHVDLPIVKNLERFARSNLVFDEVKSLAIGLRRTQAGLISAYQSLEHSMQPPGIDDLLRATNTALDALAQLEPSPSGPHPFGNIPYAADQAQEIGISAQAHILNLQNQYDEQNQGDRTSPFVRREPYGKLLNQVYQLRAVLNDVVETSLNAKSLADSQMLLLKGDGGTGKTHMLCDFAKKRIDAQLPTVILMGQRFLSEDDPWVQLLQHLDLPDVSAETFVGALEAAAQASGSRALVLVDALNEGNGRRIWPDHLVPFLLRLERSPWIGVVVSVRSSYEDVVISENVRDKAVHLTHTGFEDDVYNATLAYFSYYGIEFPSAPLLQPEFRNPLFLKTICKGLHDKGETRIPRGFQGITAVFELYLESINSRLANGLDYDPRDNLVRAALHKLSEVLVGTGDRWLPRARAEEVVNEILRRDGLSRSLYQGLVNEGVIVEKRAWWDTDSPEEVVFISYERFTDHIIADYLLRSGPDKWRNLVLAAPRSKRVWRSTKAAFHGLMDFLTPKSRFPGKAGLALLQREEPILHQGLVEALCVNVPEQTGRELTRLVPKLLDSPATGDAFLKSIVWRRLESFSEETREVFNELLQSEKIWDDPIDALLTISTVPDHPFNADFLDRRLRRDSMPERDSWWSIYLHRTRGTQKSIDRLVDWASGLEPSIEIEGSVVDLASTTLAWMLSTPNRPLRDRATKALVCLLTERSESTVRLVDRFADVDDLYVSERVYAAAYGVAMRSHNVALVGSLAAAVYKHVFASGSPPAHILLRDYARGIIERALYLGANISLDENLVRPPYRSIWPSIPSEECVEALTPGRDRGAWDGGDLEWSRNRIRWSVMGDDFAHYVIGDDSSSDWLSLGLEEERWKSPEERKQALLLQLDDSELAAWDEYQTAKSEMPLLVRLVFGKIGDAEDGSDDAESSRVISVDQEPYGQVDEETHEQARRKVELSYEHLMAVLAENHRAEMESVLREESEREGREGPRFEKKLIQRYIVWRVFDLGWTIERFGYFDRFDIGYSGRDAAKPERMGKKYQWIAYHEIMAYISDHFQYRDRWGSPRDDHYEGPWQQMVRDIDPSFTLLSRPGGTSWSSHTSAWWSKDSYESWDEGVDHGEWVSRKTDIPEVKPFLAVVDPTDATRWLNVNGHFVWQQSHPADVEPYDVVRREIWFTCIGYFIKEEDVATFTEWAKSAENIQLTSLGTRDLFGVFIGEYGWAPAFKYSDDSDENEPEPFRASDWQKFARPAFQSYHAGISGFDCSADDAMNLSLPHHDFVGRLRLKWDGVRCVYVDEEGKVGAFDPTTHESGPTAFLLREDLIKEYLADQGLTLCWVIIGEKWVMGERLNREFHGRLKISGVYQYTDQGPDGQLDVQLDIPERQ